MEHVWPAFGLTLLAGLATGIGSALAFFTSRTNTKFLSIALGFSAGVMLYVSFIEIFQKARDSLITGLGQGPGNALTVAAFFSGIGLAALIDRLVPDFENPHEIRGVEQMQPGQIPADARLLRMGLFSALAIAIHNFPEGLATFIAALNDLSLGISTAVAIAIHNIPEGIAVAVPIYYATGSRKKAFGFSFASGLAEPAGALLGYLVLMFFFNDLVFGIMFASVGGIMVYIALDELLPCAERYGEHHLAVTGLVSGMFVMALSLLLFI
jgi:ZIP family zinc transporter